MTLPQSVHDAARDAMLEHAGNYSPEGLAAAIEAAVAALPKPVVTDELKRCVGIALARHGRGFGDDILADICSTVLWHAVVPPSDAGEVARLRAEVQRAKELVLEWQGKAAQAGRVVEGLKQRLEGALKVSKSWEMNYDDSAKAVVRLEAEIVDVQAVKESLLKWRGKASQAAYEVGQLKAEVERLKQQLDAASKRAVTWSKTAWQKNRDNDRLTAEIAELRARLARGHASDCATPAGPRDCGAADKPDLAELAENAASCGNPARAEFFLAFAAHFRAQQAEAERVAGLKADVVQAIKDWRRSEYEGSPDFIFAAIAALCAPAGGA